MVFQIPDKTFTIPVQWVMDQGDRKERNDTLILLVFIDKNLVDKTICPKDKSWKQEKLLGDLFYASPLSNPRRQYKDMAVSDLLWVWHGSPFLHGMTLASHMGLHLKLTFMGGTVKRGDNGFWSALLQKLPG